MDSYREERRSAFFTLSDMWQVLVRVFKPANSVLVGALIALTLARTVDRVLYTRLAADFSPYMWYLSSVILTVGFLFLSWPVVWFYILFTDRITPEMRQFPKYKFAIMAAFDTAFNLLSTFPQPYLGGPLMLALSQFVLPCNMLASSLFLRSRYTKVHYIGAFLTIYGALVNLMPFLSGQDSAGYGSEVSAKWIAVALISAVPAAASNTYKERALKGADLDEWYVNAWVATFQLMWGLLCFWTLSIKGFNEPTVQFADMPSFFKNANDCFLGAFGLGDDETCHYEGETSSAGYKEIFPVFVAFIIFNLSYNQLMLFIFKRGSSVLFVVASAVGLPLSDLLYAWPWIAGSAFAPFTIYDGFALVVLVVAILTYYSEKELRAPADSDAENDILKTPMLGSPNAERAHPSAAAAPENTTASYDFDSGRPNYKEWP